jgi:HSP20 family protein
MSQAHPKMIAANISLEKIELRRLQKKVERLFSALEEALESEASGYFDTFSPSVDICENEKNVQVVVELPGVSSDGISLRVTAKDIIIEGEKKHSPTAKKMISHFCCERQYGKFQRRIQLRWAININETTAELKDGTLNIILPKLIDRRGTSVIIPIKSEE